MYIAIPCPDFTLCVQTPQLCLERRSVFLRIEKGDLGEDGLEPRRVFGLLMLDFGVVLQWSLGLIRLLISLEFALLVLQRKRGVEGLLLDKKPSFEQLLGLGLGLGICCPFCCCESCACLSTK